MRPSAFTPAADTIYLPGNQPELGPWNPSALALTRVDATHWTTTVEFLDGTALEYKYTRGSWDTVEWWEEIYSFLNRTLTVDYGTDGTRVVNDNAPNWRDPLVVSSDPANGATGVAVDAALKVVFNRALKAEDLTADKISLKQVETDVPGAIAWDEASLTLTFTPAAALAAGTAYTLTIGAGIRDDADNAATQNAVTVMFTTAP